MGVADLWDVFQPAGQVHSFKKLAVVEGFESNASGKRALRIGVDSSLWYKYVKEQPGATKGENGVIRGLFFKVNKLAQLPVIPVFVFDGRNRPRVKRGSKMGKTGSDPLNKPMQEILDAFGIEWRFAEGEAEAELAYLNYSGVIDAVLTDDNDAFVFGARTIIRNIPGKATKRELDLNGKHSEHHCKVFRAEDLESHPRVRMTRGGMILYALLAGGDYDKGAPGFGKVVAHSLAKRGFGDSLLDAYKRHSGEAFHVAMIPWREAVNVELIAIKRRYPAIKEDLRLPTNFPDMVTLVRYVDPATSISAGRTGGGQLRDDRTVDPGKIAALCEKYFEWGIKSVMLKRFRSPTFNLWGAVVMTILRRAALEQDVKERNKRLATGNQNLHIHGTPTTSPHDAVGTDKSLVKKYLQKNARAGDLLDGLFENRGPQPQLTTTPLIKIKTKGSYAYTDFVDEYEIEVDPTDFVELAEAGIKGTRPESHLITGNESESEDDEESPRATTQKKKKKKKEHNDSDLYKMKCPATILKYVDPKLVEAFERGIEDNERTKRDAETAKVEKAQARERKAQEKAAAKTERERERERKKKEKEEKTAAAAASKGERKGKGKAKRKSVARDSDASSDERQAGQTPSPQKKRRTSKENLKEISSCRGESSKGSVSRRSPGLMPFPLSLDLPSFSPSPDRVLNENYNPRPFSGSQLGRLPRSSPDMDMDADEFEDPDLRNGFRFTLPESDNPDYLERGDLNERFRKDLRTQARWSDVGPSTNVSNDTPDDDMDILNKDDMLDKQFEASFRAQAKSKPMKNNQSKALKATQAKETVKPNQRAVKVGEATSSSQSTKSSRLVRITPAAIKRIKTIPDAASASTSHATAPVEGQGGLTVGRYSSPLFSQQSAVLLQTDRSVSPTDMSTLERGSSLFLPPLSPSPPPEPMPAHKMDRNSSVISSQSTVHSDVIDIDTDSDGDNNGKVLVHNRHQRLHTAPLALNRLFRPTMNKDGVIDIA